MTVRFTCNNEPLQLISGLPDNYRSILACANAYHCPAPFGLLVLEEIETPVALLRSLRIVYEKPAAIVCRHTHEQPVLYVRTTPEHPAYEFIKGVGMRHFREKQYNWLSGKNWISLLRPHEPGHYSFFDMAWQADFLNTTCENNAAARFQISNVRERVPENIAGPRHYLSTEMQQLLIRIRHTDPSVDGGTDLHDQMAAYLKLLIADDKTYTWERLGIREEDWEAVQRAIAVINETPEIHYTIPEISRKAAINEFKLKKLFPRITGYTIDDYRKNLLLSRTRDLLADTRESIKTIYPHSGYNSFSAYSAGFRKMFYCSPGEIRSDDWDTGSFSK